MVPFVRGLPAPLREPLRRWWRARYGGPSTEADVGDFDAAASPAVDPVLEIAVEAEIPPKVKTNAADVVHDVAVSLHSELPPTPEQAYQQRIAQETSIFTDLANVHELPDIFHYWSNRYLLPMEQPFDAQHPEDFIARRLFESAQRTGAARPRFVSLGSGNCDAEIRVAQDLVRRGLQDFVLECIDINPAMLERGRVLACDAGLEGRVVPTPGDFNRWSPDGLYDGVMANQSLHHVLELESLFDAVAAALKPEASFVVSDMIGRNGHLRWPEALAIVREFWSELPEAFRYNRQLSRLEQEFMDWDCSTEGFEGVRAQDILPLLMERFGFEVFLAFGNVIDPFIDRGFGHNFDPGREWDRDFIDRVHRRDEAEILAGNITPTHMMAVLVKDRAVACTHRAHLTPAFCVRRATSRREASTAERGYADRAAYLADLASMPEALAARATVELALDRLASAEAVEFHCEVHDGLTNFRTIDGAAINWREGVQCPRCQVNARMRFCLALMRRQTAAPDLQRVYLTEQTTYGYAMAKRLFPLAQGSEYVGDELRRPMLTEYIRLITNDPSATLNHQDATQLTFADASFDALGSFDVLEHIPDYCAALREFARVLRPGGSLTLTAPFLRNADTTLTRARLRDDGSIEHLHEPEYHGDPVAEGGVLCFHHFGWDLLRATRDAGFGHVELVTTWSPALGYLGAIEAVVARR